MVQTELWEGLTRIGRGLNESEVRRPGTSMRWSAATLWRCVTSLGVFVRADAKAEFGFRVGAQVERLMAYGDEDGDGTLGLLEVHQQELCLRLCRCRCLHLSLAFGGPANCGSRASA